MKIIINTLLYLLIHQVIIISLLFSSDVPAIVTDMNRIIQNMRVTIQSELTVNYFLTHSRYFTSPGKWLGRSSADSAKTRPFEKWICLKTAGKREIIYLTLLFSRY